MNGNLTWRKYGFIFLICFIGTFSVYAQSNNPKINLDVKNRSLVSVLDELSAQYDLHFAYDAGRIRKIKTSVTVQDFPVEQLLDSLLAGTRFCHKKISETYTLYQCREEKPIYTFRAVVSDGQSSEVLPFASVYINRTRGTISNELGIVNFSATKDTMVQLQVNFLGYHKLDTLIHTGNPDVFYSLKLEKKTSVLKTVSIKRNYLASIEPGNEAGEVVLNPYLSRYLPNLGEPDILNALSILPGVSSLGGAGGFSIRGSTPASSLVLLDGFTVYKLDHFLGNVSTVNPKFIKNIRISKGGFGARYGESIAGVIHITGKNGNKNKPAVDASINLLNLNVVAELPISEKLNVLIAGRRSYTELARTYLLRDIFNISNQTKRADTGIGIFPDFNFYDYHTKFSYQPSKSENLSLSLYASSDKLDYSVKSDYQVGFYEVKNLEKWSNNGLSLQWDKQISKRFFTSWNANVSSFNNYKRYVNKDVYYQDSEEEDEYLNNVDYENDDQIKGIELSAQNRYVLSEKQTLSFGFSVKKNNIDAVYNNIGDSISEPIIDRAAEGVRTSFFGELAVQPKSWLNIVAGLRGSYIHYLSEMYWEPRLAVTYQISPKLEFHHEAGIYYQFLKSITQYDDIGNITTTWGLPSDGFAPSYSTHLQCGFSYSDNGWLVNLDFYKRRSENVGLTYIFSNAAADDEKQFVEDGSGVEKSFGAELFVKKRFDRLMSMASLSLGKTRVRFNDINDGNYIKAENDRPFQVDICQVYTLGRWHFSVLWKYYTGTPYIDYDNSNYKFSQGRIPDFHNLDLSVVYDYQFPKFKGSVGISLLNTYNQRNVLRRQFYTYGTENDGYTTYSYDVLSNKMMPVMFLNFKF